ncbi:MAG: glycosyltransferase [Albidovulum sp.]|nr:MAG: glycosyltransferase [Defluviimonas sp.]
MSSRLRNLFRQYAIRHARLELGALPLLDGAGKVSGHVDRVQLAGGMVDVHGWSNCRAISLICDGFRSETYPNIPREDVVANHADMAPGTLVGFSVSVPSGRGAWMLICHDGPERVVHILPKPGRIALRLAQLRLAPGFVLRLAASLPDYLKWSLLGDVAARTSYRKRLGLDLLPLDVALDPRIFATPDPEDEQARPSAEITIVLPVYNALELLTEALARIVAHTDVPWRLIAVEDCSTDPAVRPFLRDWLARQDGTVADRVEILENERNLGFVESVNRALDRAVPLGNHVVLLNSDALVPPGWASRLLRPVLTHDAVATVTPMSNDAEILSVPTICQRTVLAPGEAEAINRTAATFHPDACLVEMPTGVGFCMLLNIDFLRRVPALDTAFGRGYGEEVDWCQKVRALGGRNIGHGGLFVEHRGGTSFGSVEKLKLVQAHNAIISARYPGYDAEVQNFIRHDPLRTPRLALAIAWAGVRARGPVPVFLAHSLGGGAEDYLKHRLQRDIEATGAAVVLRVGGALRWRVECHSAHGVVAGAVADFTLVQWLLDPLPSRRVIYSCGVGDTDPVTLPGHLLELVRDGDGPEVLVHDYFMVSPSYNLLNGEGVFAGVPSPGGSDRAHRVVRPEGKTVTLASWRAEWGRLMSAATRVTVFSHDSRKHLLAAYPECADRIDIVPHRLPNRIHKVALTAASPPVIGVLGNIGPAKGAAVVERLSRALETSPVARLVLVGNIAPGFTLAPATIVHGTYAPDEIANLAERYRISAWFIPSIWPETFSFTTHEALATGLPVACFDLGAQAEAVSKSATGRLIPLDHASGAVERIVADILGVPA